MTAANSSPIRLVPEPNEGRPEKVFCGHCGTAPESDKSQASRVCSSCGMGLLLSAPIDAAPNPADPFMVIDASLNVCALSRKAEELLQIPETDAVNRHVSEFLVPAEAEAPTGQNLAALITWAARGDAPPSSVVVRPRNTFGVRYWARIGRCGPPRAALLVLADAR